MKYKLKKIDEHLEKKLKDPYFKELYELEQQNLELVKKIIAYRIDNNITQEELADEIGVTQQYISKIENCEVTNLDALLRVLLYIGFRVKIEPVQIRSNRRTRVRRVIRKMALA